MTETENLVLPRATEVDVMLLLEGTYPFVSGGVSSWVNQIIRGFPEIRFGAVFIGSRPQDYGKPKYELAPNVVHLECHYVHSLAARPEIRAAAADPKATRTMEALHAYFRANRARSGAPDPQAGGCPVAHDNAPLVHALTQLSDSGALSQSQFLFGESAWRFIAENYRKFCTDPSFVDYFWTVRTMHAPVWALSRIADKLIPARVYHTVSTGYAGFLGALLKLRTQRPLLVSEHGIYTKERKIDLFQSDWIRDNRNVFERDSSEVAYFRDLWIRFFSAMGRACYDQADHIVALFESNRLRQVADGAPDERTENIPNGVNVKRLAPLRDKRPEVVPPVACLVGRVVPIKDIETFVRAMRTIVNKFPKAEGWIAGPEDEDPQYAHDCKVLARGLGLEKNVKFLGFQRIDELMPKIGLVVLSSISEGLPLVILEGYAAGVPTVSTDVGSCRQLVHGFGREDVALGRSGRIVKIADPEGLARACIELLGDPQAWNEAQTAAIRRVEKYYTQEQMFESYRTIYERLLATEGVPARVAGDA